MIDTYLATRTGLRRTVIALLIGCGVAAAALLYNVDPSTTSIYPRCALHSLTGLHCPGCGATRAVHALLHARVADAMRFNSLFVVGLPGVMALAYWQRRPTSSAINRARVAKAIFVVLLAYTVARNVPYYPLELLAPHQIPVQHEEADVGHADPTVRTNSDFSND